jgi:hypothetical protein
MSELEFLVNSKSKFKILEKKDRILKVELIENEK